MRTVDRDHLAPWLAARVGCHGLGADWQRLAAALGAPGAALARPPTGRQDQDSQTLDLGLARLGLALRFVDAGERAVLADGRPAQGLERWGLARLVLHGPEDTAGDGYWPYRLPFGLDWERTTPEQARGWLGDDTTPAPPTAADPRVSYFLGDNRVVELRFNSPRPGIHRISIVHLLNTVAFEPGRPV